MEHAERRADGSLVFPERAPGKSHAGFYSSEVIVVEQMFGIGAGQLKGERGGTAGVDIQVREFAVGVIGHAVELIARAHVQGQAAAEPPAVLQKESVFVLAEATVIVGNPGAAFVEELRLELGVGDAE